MLFGGGEVSVVQGLVPVLLIVIVAEKTSPVVTLLGAVTLTQEALLDSGVLKIAITVLLAFMVTLQVVPETPSQPDQPPNVEPEAADGVRETEVL